MWQIRQLMAKIAKTEEVRKRRSDPEFTDFQRYVTDMRYILKALKEKCKVLDIGAGAGVFSIALAHLGFDVTATNLVIEDRSETNFFWKFGCKFVSLNLDHQKMPFLDEEFDAVLCLHVVEHLKKPLLALREMRRVLRLGGKLILMTPNGAITSMYKRLSLQPNKSIQNNSHVKEYTLNELVYMLTVSGFEIRNIGYSNAMVFAGFSKAHTMKKLIGLGYCLLCNLLPAISYEIHITAQAKNKNTEV